MPKRNCPTDCSNLPKPRNATKPCKSGFMTTAPTFGGSASKVEINNDCTNPIAVTICDRPDYEFVCAESDGRLLIAGIDQDTGVATLTELDGSTIADGTTAVNCDIEYVERDFCFQDITDPSIRYTKLVIFNANNLTTPIGAIWFDAMGDVISEPSNIEVCSDACIKLGSLGTLT